MEARAMSSETTKIAGIPVPHPPQDDACGCGHAHDGDSPEHHHHHHHGIAPQVRAARKVGRNDRCPCGSGKKYKKCCLTAA
jgi:preprotein translocase subunit SecA